MIFIQCGFAFVNSSIKLKFQEQYLNTFGESLQLFCREFNSWGALTDEGHDGDSSVASNNGAVDLGRVDVLELADESVGPDHVQGGDAEDSLGVQAARLLVDLTGNGDCGVHWI